MKKKWWKILCVAILIYSILGALLFDVPRLAILNETIRNLHFHVTMWFAMIILLTTSVVYAIKYLRSNKIEHDQISVEFANAGVLFGMLGGACFPAFAFCCLAFALACSLRDLFMALVFPESYSLFAWCSYWKLRVSLRLPVKLLLAVFVVGCLVLALTLGVAVTNMSLVGRVSVTVMVNLFSFMSILIYVLHMLL